MGEGDPRAVSARLPGSILQATGIRLAIATYLCYCVMQVRALRRAAGKLHCLAEELEIPKE